MAEKFIQSYKQKYTKSEKISLVASEDLKYFLGSIWMSAINLLPSSLQPVAIRRISRYIGNILKAINSTDGQIVRTNLKKLFAGQWTDQEIEEHVRKQLTLTAWNSLVLGLLPYMRAIQIGQLFVIEGLKCIDKILDRGKPCLLLGCHLGPYALPVAAFLQGCGYPLHYIGHAFPRQNTSRLYRKVYYERVIRICEAINIINPLDGPKRQLLEIFQKGEVLFLLPDQYFILEDSEKQNAHMVQIKFLGGKVNLESGGIRLAKRMGAEVLTALPDMMNERYRICLKPMKFATEGTNPDDLGKDLKKFLELIEEILRDQPFLWRDLRRKDLLERLNI